MINVLHLRDTDRICGPGKTILETAARIDPAEFQLMIGIFAVEGEKPNLYYDAALARGVSVRRLITRHQYDPRIVSRIREVIQDERIDIIHSHEYKSDIIGFVVSKLTGVPIVTTAHGWITNSMKGRIYISLGKRVMRYFDRVIAVSPLIRDQLIASGVTRDRIRVVYNAIVVENYRPASVPAGTLRKTLGIPADVPLVGNVGRLSPEKGQEDFIKAARQVLNMDIKAHFVLAGSGPDELRLREMVTELGIQPRVHFLGHLGDVRSVFRDCDVIALTSYTEGFPNVLLESLCMGTPIIATRVGGVPDIVEDGVTGVLVEPHAVDDIASGIAHLLREPAWAAQLVQNGRRRIEQRFRFEVRVTHIENIYREVMGARSITNRARLAMTQHHLE